MGWSLRPQWFYFLIFKHNLDVCHPNSHRMLQESSFTLECGNSPYMENMWAYIAYVSCLFSGSVYSRNPLWFWCPAPTTSYINSLVLSPAIVSSLYTFSPQQCDTSISCILTPLCPPPSSSKTSMVNSGHNRDLVTQTVPKGKQAWVSRWGLNKKSPA